MKAARFYALDTPLRIEDIPVPEIGDDEVLVQIKAVGLCGTDIHILKEGQTLTAFKPITPGHEAAGVVARVGSAVEGWMRGDRVSVLPGIYCGACHQCLQGRDELCEYRRMIGIQAEGALAEYLKVPAKNLVRLPAHVPFTVGAILTDAAATPYHALIDRAALQRNETVAVFGVGGLGLHAVQIAKVVGTRSIIAVDIRAEQLERARAVGADITINSRDSSPVPRIMQATGGRGVDVAAEFVGFAATIAQAVESAAPGGRIVVSGIGPEAIKTVSPAVLVRRELTLMGSYAFTRQTIERLMALVASGKLALEASVTHIFSLDEVNQGLNVLQKKIGNPTRVVITLP
ncbi:MAG TPA: zinc-binding dehydrogenase [Ktedonobacteraceae bacterium]|nr:zinc-binding dehydrogenase [Ktedonobacteraceae bacterium]